MSQLISGIPTCIRYVSTDSTQVVNPSIKTLTCSSLSSCGSHLSPASAEASLKVMHHCVTWCRLLSVLKVITLNLSNRKFNSEMSYSRGRLRHSLTGLWADRIAHCVIFFPIEQSVFDNVSSAKLFARLCKKWRSKKSLLLWDTSVRRTSSKEMTSCRSID